MPRNASATPRKQGGKAPIVLDAWAILAFLQEEEPAATVVTELFKECRAGRQPLLMSMINVGEAYYRLIATQGKNEAERRCRQLLRTSARFESVDDELVWRAAELKGTYELSYADAFAAALALRLDARLASGDPDFKPLESGAGLRMRWLSREGKK
jgi:predicted nucleic acid-binding protein